MNNILGVDWGRRDRRGIYPLRFGWYPLLHPHLREIHVLWTCIYSFRSLAGHPPLEEKTCSVNVYFFCPIDFWIDNIQTNSSKVCTIAYFQSQRCKNVLVWEGKYPLPSPPTPSSCSVASLPRWPPPIPHLRKTHILWKCIHVPVHFYTDNVLTKSPKVWTRSPSLNPQNAPPLDRLAPSPAIPQLRKRSGSGSTLDRQYSNKFKVCDCVFIFRFINGLKKF